MDINYDRCNISNRIKNEIVNTKGEVFWKELSQDIIVPSDDMGWQQASSSMRGFMEKFQGLIPAEEIKAIMVNVRHDLQLDDFDWAVRLFNQVNNIDQFAIALQKIGIGVVVSEYIRKQADSGASTTLEMIEFVQGIENIFYGRRHGNVILAQAIPFDVKAHLHAPDDRQRRYALCHCQFARQSLLQGEVPVSPLLCECSLGHTMMLWEIVLGRKLEGEVLESALKGSNRCLFKIKLPEDIIARWT